MGLLVLRCQSYAIKNHMFLLVLRWVSLLHSGVFWYFKIHEFFLFGYED